MKITKVEYEVAYVQQTHPLKIAFAVIDRTPTIFLKLTTDEGIIGYGEACPFSPVTGENEKTVLAALETFTPGLVGADPYDLQGIHAMMDNCLYGNGSAKCAVDIACYDIIGKKAQQPLYKILGSGNNKLVTDVTIGINKPEIMAERATEWVKKGFNILKIKTGINPDEDVEAIRLMRESFGYDVLIRVDGNQGYTVGSALDIIPRFAKLGVKAVEQPLPYWDIDGLATVRRNALSYGVQIMADESLHSPHDALRLCQTGAVDVLNIKLMKCGGIYPALKIDAIGEAYGVNCMVGCMFDTKLALSAAVALVAAKKNITEADTDAFLLINDQGKPMHGGFTNEGSVITCSEAPGLGIDIDF